MLWMCSNTLPQHVILLTGTEKYPFFYNFDIKPIFPQFLLYVKYKGVVTFVRRRIRDVALMWSNCNEYC